MAYGQDGPYRSYPAGADLSTHQWKAMVLDSSGLLQLATVAGGRIDGILQDDPKAAAGGTIKIRDITKAIAGGTFAIGALLQVNGSGLLITATAGNQIVAKARQAGVNGRIVSVELGNAGIV